MTTATGTGRDEPAGDTDPTPPPEPVCANCGAKIDPGDVICPNCGESLVGG